MHALHEAGPLRQVLPRPALGPETVRLALLRAPLPGRHTALAHRVGAALDHTCWSHGEIVFADRTTGSSWSRGGVALRKFDESRYAADIWDYYELPDSLEADARQWFVDHAGQPYDVLGPARFALGVLRQTEDRWYCHEATAEALGLPDSWRWTGGLFVSLGPVMWPRDFRKVPAPWYVPPPTTIVRCSRD